MQSQEPSAGDVLSVTGGAACPRRRSRFQGFPTHSQTTNPLPLAVAAGSVANGWRSDSRDRWSGTWLQWVLPFLWEDPIFMFCRIGRLSLTIVPNIYSPDSSREQALRHLPVSEEGTLAQRLDRLRGQAPPWALHGAQRPLQTGFLRDGKGMWYKCLGKGGFSLVLAEQQWPTRGHIHRGGVCSAPPATWDTEPSSWSPHHPRASLRATQDRVFVTSRKKSGHLAPPSLV